MGDEIPTDDNPETSSSQSHRIDKGESDLSFLADIVREQSNSVQIIGKAIGELAAGLESNAKATEARPTFAKVVVLVAFVVILSNIATVAYVHYSTQGVKTLIQSVKKDQQANHETGVSNHELLNEIQDCISPTGKCATASNERFTNAVVEVVGEVTCSQFQFLKVIAELNPTLNINVPSAPKGCTV